MKKMLMMCLLLAMCLAVLTACVLQVDGSGNVELPQASAVAEAIDDIGEDIAKISESTEIETDGFTMTAVDGWTRMDIDGGVQLYKGNEVLQITVGGFNVTEEEDKAQLESLAEQYDGTAIDTVELLGLNFYRTTFTASGVEQTFYSAVRDGQQIHIQLSGKDPGSNADIKAMLDSVKLK